MNDIVQRIRGESQSASQTSSRGEPQARRLISEISATPAGPDELAAVPVRGTQQLREFWALSRNAILFKDADYGQWGLRILSPREALVETESERAARPTDFKIDDVVFAQFIGDLDLLLVDGQGRIVVAMEMDRRESWPVVGSDLRQFLLRYLSSRGDKFWEPSLA